MTPSQVNSPARSPLRLKENPPPAGEPIPADAPADSLCPAPAPRRRTPPAPTRPEHSPVGVRGERIAARYLRDRGLALEDRNYRARSGEIDLIARDRDQFVFVEVKTRRSAAFGSPEEAVTPRKQNRLVQTAQEYLKERRLENCEWRIDVVAITLASNAPPHVVHIRSAVEQ